MSDAAHTLVMASAGSGKTYQLTGAYLRHALALLREDPHANLGALLATTFTRKAAGEILARVFGRLVDASGSERGLRELSSQVGVPVSRQEALRALSALALQLHRLSICTIDALFQRIAWAHGHELGAPAGWSIADERTLSEQWTRAVSATLRSADPDELLRLAEALSDTGLAKLGFRKQLQDALRDVRDAVAGRTDAEDVWGIIGPEDAPLTHEQFARALDALERAPLPPRSDGQPATVIAKAQATLLVMLRAGAWQDALASKLLRAPLTTDTYSKIKLTPQYRACLLPLTLHVRAVLLARLRARNLGTLRLAVGLLREVQRERSRTGQLAFDDVPRMLLEAKVTQNPAQVYEGLDARVRHVLLDEFQDTSLTQFLLLRPMLDEILAGDPGERSLFCVGDVKQSLYSWRGGAPQLMPMLPQTWPQLRVQDLAESHRSSRVVLDVVNEVFTSLHASPCLADTPGALAQWRTRFTPHTARRDLRGQASLFVCDDAAQAIVHAALRVRDIVGRAPWASVGVLVATGKQVTAMLRSLRRAGVLASGERGTPLTDSIPVGVALSMLRLARFPGHAAAAFHVATSPLGALIGLGAAHGAREREEASRRLRRAMSERGHAWFLRSLAPEVRRSADARGVARYEQMLDIVDRFERKGGTDTGALLTLLEAESAEDPTQRTVRVMTIHASKGLEFDAVVLPCLCERWDKPPAVLLERQSPLHAITAATLRPTQELIEITPRLDRMMRAHREQQRDESLCGLYVAITRAVHSVDMYATEADLKLDKAANGARVLLATLAHGADLTDPAKHAAGAGAGCARVFASGEESWCDGPPAHAPRDPAPPALVATPLTPPPDRAWHSFVRARRVQPSAPAPTTGAVGMVRTPHATTALPASDTPRLIGLLLHAWLAEIAWLEPTTRDACDAILARAAADLRTGDAALREACEIAHRFLLSPGARCLMRPAESDGWRVLREWEFRLPEEERDGAGTRIVAGRLDRVVVRVEGGRAVACEVLDYKTEALATSPQEGAVRHAGQLRAYARSVGALLRIPRDRVAMTVVFVREGVSAPVNWEDA